MPIRFFKRLFHRVLAFRPNRRLLKPIGYSTLFSVFFSFFLVLSLPLDRFIPNAEDLLSKATSRKVRIGDLSTSITGGFVLSDVEIGMGDGQEKEVPVAADAKNGKKLKKALPVGYQIEELDVDVGMLSMLLFNELDLDVEVSALDGTLHVSYEGPLPESMRRSSEETPPAAPDKLPKNVLSKKTATPDSSAEEAPESESEEAEVTPVALEVGFEDISLTEIHDLRDALPVPIAGTLNLDMTLESETSSFAEAKGKLDFVLSDLMLSRNGYEATIMGSSLKVPPIAIETMAGTINFEKGVGKVTKFEVTSKDCAITLQGTITLNDSLSKSQNDLYITFNLLGDYLKKSAAIKTLLASADTFSREMKNAHRADGAYGFRYHGVFGKGRFTPAKEYKPTPKDSGKKLKDRKKAKRKRRKAARRPPAGQPAAPASIPGVPAITPPPAVPPAVAAPSAAAPMEPPEIDTREQIRHRFGRESTPVNEPEEAIVPPEPGPMPSRTTVEEAAEEEQAPPEQEEAPAEEEQAPQEQEEAPAEEAPQEDAPQDDGEGAQNEEPQEEPQEEVEMPEPQEQE